MQFQTAYYWQQGENRTSLVLQQYAYGAVPILFSCICGGGTESEKAGGYMAERLSQWFRELNLKKLACRPELGLENAESGLRKLIARTDRELAAAKAVPGKSETSFSGILCVEGSFCLFYRGEQRIYLTNTCFGRSYTKRLDKEGGRLALERGTVQPELGLLFATGTFCEKLTEQALREVLSVKEIKGEERLERRLRELGEEAARQGGRDLAAVFIRTVREEKDRESLERKGTEREEMEREEMEK